VIIFATGFNSENIPELHLLVTLPQKTTVVEFPLSVTLFPLSVTLFPLSVTLFPLTVTLFPLSVTYFPLSVTAQVVASLNFAL
jgi:hypothetical protein